MNVLITGSRGFVGQNLKKRLNGVNIYEFNRGDSFETFDNLQNIDAVFHFAGEVDPKLDENRIVDGNSGLTEIIAEKLKKIKKPLLIVFSSSIHAQLQKNSYGKAKRKAEKVLEELAFNYGHKVVIYRLPHLFGEGCKPNHNSVITTWIYNCINNKELVIFDKNMKITYAYIKDLVDEFSQELIKGVDNEILVYKKPAVVFNTTLGDVAERICEFKELILKNKIRDMNEFEKRLFETVRYYLNKSL